MIDFSNEQTRWLLADLSRHSGWRGTVERELAKFPDRTYFVLTVFDPDTGSFARVTYSREDLEVCLAHVVVTAGAL